MSVQNKVILVTGAGRGIGEASARLLATRGAKLVLADLDGAEEVADKIKADGGVAFGTTTDISQRPEVEALVAKTLELHDRVDVLVNSAGVYLEASLEETDDELWRRTMDVNLYGTYLTNTLVLKPMLERGGGRIVNFSSGAVITPVPDHAAYTASKGGVVAFTKSLQFEYARRGIVALVVSPGITNTPMIHPKWPPEVIPEREKRMKFGRLMLPEEVAEVVAFVASEDSAHLLAGQTLHTYGGEVLV